MTHHLEHSQWPKADGDRLSDAHHGLLLDDLQLSTRITEHPERFRRALALVAGAE